MKCKNKEIIVRGTCYIDGLNRLAIQPLRCICTNDEKGKTLSIDNGTIQFSIPMEQIMPCFEGSYVKGR